MTTGPAYEINVDSVDSARLVTARGEIDTASAPELESALVAEPNGPVVADLTGVGFIDSTGLRALLMAKDALDEAGGRLLLVVSEGPVERILALTGVTDQFQIHSTVEDATQALP